MNITDIFLVLKINNYHARSSYHINRIEPHIYELGRINRCVKAYHDRLLIWSFHAHANSSHQGVFRQYEFFFSTFGLLSLQATYACTEFTPSYYERNKCSTQWCRKFPTIFPWYPMKIFLSPRKFPYSYSFHTIKYKVRLYAYYAGHDFTHFYSLSLTFYKQWSLNSPFLIFFFPFRINISLETSKFPYIGQFWWRQLFECLHFRCSSIPTLPNWAPFSGKDLSQVGDLKV